MIEETTQVYEATLEVIRRGKPAAMVTVIDARGSTPRGVGAKMLVHADGRAVGTVGGGDVEACAVEGAQAALTEGRPRQARCRARDEGGEVRLFIEVLTPRPTLLILGGGHIGQAVAELGDFLGYRVAVVDEREGLVTLERFPATVQRLTGDYAQQVSEFLLSERTYLVIVTPHQNEDEQILAALVDRPVAYVGMIGSSRRTAHTFEQARALGVPDSLLERIHTPVGLDIGAETPREIAVSIISEIIAVRRRA
jgi:xanthine dehydrogenase accessory factor